MAATTQAKGNPSFLWGGLISGLLLIFIGWQLLANPASTAYWIMVAFGLFWLINGVVDIVGAIFSHEDQNRGWRVAGGVLGVIAGLIVLNNSVVSTVFTVAFLTYFLVFSFIFNGIMRMFIGSTTPDGKRKWSWGDLIIGLIFVLLGLWLLGGSTLVLAASFVWAMGLLAIFGGIVAVVSAFAFRNK